MKAILVLLLFVTFSSFSQTNETAYSLAIKLSRFEYKEKPDDSDIDDARDLLSQLLFYTGEDNYDANTDQTLRKYASLYECFRRLEGTFFYCDSTTLMKLIDSPSASNITVIIRDLKKDKKKNNELISDTTYLKSLDSEIEIYKRRADTIKEKDDWLKKINQDLDEFRGLHDSIEIHRDRIRIKDSLNNILFRNDSIFSIDLKEQLLLKQKETYLSIEAKKRQQTASLVRMNQTINSLTGTTRSKLLDKVITTKPSEYSFTILNANLRSSSQYERIFLEPKQQSSTPTGSISFKMPSESEMIEAAAIYLAKRVKQEAVLWFFDEMRKNAETYDLLSTAFPTTITLLQSEDFFRTPNLSVAWRTALSKDFVMMPKNVLTSEWLRLNVPKEQLPMLEYLSSGWEIAKLVEQRYSYREIVKQLYLNKKDPPASSTKITPNTLIDVLYAFSTELYVGTDSLRLIGYEDLSRMTAREMDIMLALLDMRYHECITTICSTDLYNRTTSLTRENATKISAWLGRLVVAFDHFDKVLQEMEQQYEKKANDPNYKYTYYNVWNMMSQVLMELLPEEGVSMAPGVYEEVQAYIGVLNDSYEVYDMISNKNYAGSVSKIIEIVDKLVYRDSVRYRYEDINIDKKLVFPKGKFIDDSGNKFRLSKTVFASYLAEQGVHPRKVHNILKKYPTYLSFDFTGRANISSAIDASTGSFILKLTELDFLTNRAQPLKRCIRGFESNNSIPSMIETLSQNAVQWGGSSCPVGSDSIVLSFPSNSAVGIALVSNDLKSLQMMRKMASFLNDVSRTEDAESLAKVVETYALPPGSYKQKRSTWWSVDFNAFVGAYYGLESAIKSQIQVPDDMIGKIPKKGQVYGISAPIGVSLTKTFGRRLYATSEISEAYRNNPDVIKVGRSKISSISRFSMTTTVSIVDLGAIVSYRLSNTDSIASQSFRWSQFFSPGFHVGFSIPSTPLVGMLGIQYTPQLRRVKPIEEKPLNMARIYVGFFFDLPLYNMWAKSRVAKL